MNRAPLLIGAVVALLLAMVAGMASADTQPQPVPAPAAIDTSWHTFLGADPAGSDDDQGHGVTVDSAGYAYLVGQSNDGDWGSSPIVSYTFGLDGFVAQLDSDGDLLWHTFLGGSETDAAHAIAVDSADNLLVVGTSNGGTWSTVPISNAHGARDVLVAKFNTGGARQWFTFVGTSAEEFGEAIAVDGGGNIYAAGHSGPNPYLAKLNSAGEFQWQRVITSTSGDLGYAYGVAADQSGGVYLTGYSNYDDWYGAPAPVRPHSGYAGQSDAFVAKFDGDDGALLWHTFLGAADCEDQGHAVVVQTTVPTPAIYIAGWSADGWGTPVRPHAGGRDALVAQLNGDDGTLVWHTFMGNGTYGDEAHAIALDGTELLFVSGDSRSGWGLPVIPHPGGTTGDAAFVAALSADGEFRGHTFMGGASSGDTASGIAVSDQGGIYVSGASSAAWANLDWGAPVRAFSGSQDAFAAGLGAQSVVRYWTYLPITLKQ